MLTFDDFAELLVNKVSTIIGYIQEGDENRTEEEQKLNGLAPDNIEYTLKETDLVLYAARTPSPDKATYKKASGSGAGGMDGGAGGASGGGAEGAGVSGGGSEG